MKKAILGITAVAAVAVLAGCSTVEKVDSSTNSGTTTTRSAPKTETVNSNWETELRAAIRDDVEDPNNELWEIGSQEDACAGFEVLGWGAQDFADMMQPMADAYGDMTPEEVEVDAEESFGYHGTLPDHVTFDDVILIMSEEVVSFCKTIT